MIKVFMANRPPLIEYEQVNTVSALAAGEVQRIATETGNHWRKIFNVYAKFVFSLAEHNDDIRVLKYTSWQQYRDQMLLQAGSDTQLYFNHSGLTRVLERESDGIRIVMGKTFAENVLKNTELTWLDTDFAINRHLAIIVCPYFDYRQLSNKKIEILIGLVVSLQAGRSGESLT